MVRQAVTFQVTTDFSDGVPAKFSPRSGTWTGPNGRYQGSAPGDSAVTTFSLTSLGSSYLEFQATVNTTATGGLVFDYVSQTNYKFATYNPTTKQVIVGHVAGTSVSTTPPRPVRPSPRPTRSWP